MNLENQELLFSIFHDGGLEDIRDTVDGIECTIDIMYLAELINPRCRGIIVKLIYPAELYLEDVDTSETIRDFKELNKLDIEILKAQVNEDKVKVFCSINGGQSFGYLNVKASEIYIYDPERNLVSLETLKTICNHYWDGFSKNAR
ncbi:hypothetical protein ACFQI7_37735 [Paenibacillus allorhizosphaerae]|uniref:SMI1/KNR4 family protein n=1 Tax=Paenibacillus allorhizosphaerae TaxID=2849866 RepID=A0ABM8VVE4_9BACL|nr:hypothetical protein [Paenibacillus allorhizosphaerae]CAG7659232.1 hypothetical protein PAECIP111802_07492 [Paenibacillus allorhizosphaerae]